MEGCLARVPTISNTHGGVAYENGGAVEHLTEGVFDTFHKLLKQYILKLKIEDLWIYIFENEKVEKLNLNIGKSMFAQDKCFNFYLIKCPGNLKWGLIYLEFIRNIWMMLRLCARGPTHV